MLPSQRAALRGSVAVLLLPVCLVLFRVESMAYGVVLASIVVGVVHWVSLLESFEPIGLP